MIDFWDNFSVFSCDIEGNGRVFLWGHSQLDATTPPTKTFFSWTNSCQQFCGQSQSTTILAYTEIFLQTSKLRKQFMAKMSIQKVSWTSELSRSGNKYKWINQTWLVLLLVLCRGRWPGGNSNYWKWSGVEKRWGPSFGIRPSDASKAHRIANGAFFDSRMTWESVFVIKLSNRQCLINGQR